jgi:hypothetical protein
VFVKQIDRIYYVYLLRTKCVRFIVCEQALKGGIREKVQLATKFGVLLAIIHNFPRFESMSNMTYVMMKMCHKFARTYV